MKTKILLLSIFCYLLCNQSVNGQASIVGEILYEDGTMNVGDFDVFLFIDPIGGNTTIDAGDYGQFSWTLRSTQSGSTNGAGIQVNPKNDYGSGFKCS